MTAISNEAAKLLSLSMSDSESSSDTLRISIPRQKVLARRKRKRKGGTEKPLSINSYCPFALDSLPKIGKCLFCGFVLAVLIMETWLIIRASRRLDRLEAIFVDAEGKHIPESLRDVEQRLAFMRTNQSKLEQLVGQLSSQLDRINKHLELVNGSAEELRLEISNTINKQMPSHLVKMNSSIAEVQARVARVANNLVSASEKLNSLSDKQERMDGTLRSQGTSITTIEDAISGKNSSSSLARSLNSTIETRIERAQANIESSIQQAQSEIHAQMSSSLTDSITQMKRELFPAKPKVDIESMPLIASNTDPMKANDHGDDNTSAAAGRGGNYPPKRSSNISDTSASSTGSSSVPIGASTQPPTNALSTVT